MEGVLGQARALEVLQSALQSGRLHHAFIFCGPAGVGKFTTALAFAKVLLCHDRQTGLTGEAAACGHCPSCRLLPAPGTSQGASGAHPDLHVVTKELARFSDDSTVRDRKLMNIPTKVVDQFLREPVYRSAQLQHGKVFIVDEAELIDPYAQNVLLKTLEEPPADTYLILVTTNDERLLPTIRSRCQRIAFAPLPEAVLADWLDRHETPGLAAGRGGLSGGGARAWLLQFSEGSLGRVQLAVEYDLFAWATAILPALDQMVQGRFAPGIGQQMKDAIDDLATRWVDGHENASKDAANKMAAGLMWTLIARHARQRLTEAVERKADSGGSGTDLPGAEKAAQPWLLALEALTQAERNIATNVNQGLVCDHLALCLYRALAPVHNEARR